MVNRFDPMKHGGWTRPAIALTGIALGLLWLTGIVLYAWPSADTAALDSWKVDARHWAIVIHGSVVWIVCLFAGRWIWPHVAGIWRRQRSLTWFVGFATFALLVIVICTGLALLYGPGAAHDAIAGGHWWSAVVVPVIVAWHAKGLVQRRVSGNGVNGAADASDSDWS